MGWLFSSSSFNTSKSMQCYNEKLAGLCAACELFNPKNYINGMFSGYKYHCAKNNCYVRWDEPACRRISKIDPERVDCVERYYDVSGRRFFILTAIFEILGIPFENRIYTEIANMIQNARLEAIQQEDIEVQRNVIEYDIVGMDIANCLRNDPNKAEICANLLNNELVRIYCLIGKGETNEAMLMYREMVKKLYIRYHNKENYAEIIDSKTFEKKKIKTI